MDGHPVPFPSVSRIADDRSPERRLDDRTPHGRVNSSPSLPDWPLPLNQSGTRPRLNPLDLAVARPATPSPYPAKFAHTVPSPGLNSAQNSPSRKDNYFNSPRTNASSPRRQGTLLTPPLTPSSSFNSASTVATESDFGGDGDVVPSTPPDGGSPLTWGKLRMRRRSAMDLCLAGDNTAAYDQGLANSRGDAAAELAALLKRADITPKFEKKLELSAKDASKVPERERGREDFEHDATRFLLVHNASSRAAETTIRTALMRATGAQVSRTLQLEPNTVLFMFYDLRDAIRAANWIDGKTITELSCNDIRLRPATNGTLGSSPTRALPLEIEFTTRAQLEKCKTPPAPHHFAGTESALLIEACAEVHAISHEELRKVIGSMGDLVHFRRASSSVARAVRGRSRGSPTAKGRHEQQVFFADYYDANDATTARQQLDGRMMFHTRLNVYSASEFDYLLDEDCEKEQPIQEQMPYPVMSYGSLNSSAGFFDSLSPSVSSMPLPQPDSPTPTRGGLPADFKIRSRTMSSGEVTVCPDAFGRPSEREEERYSSFTPSPQGLFFDPMGRVPAYPPSLGNQRTGGLGLEECDASNYQYAHYPFGAASASIPSPYQQAMSDGMYMSPTTGYQYTQAYQPASTYGMSINAAYAGLREPWYPPISPSHDYIPSPVTPRDHLEPPPTPFRTTFSRTGFAHGKKAARNGRRGDRERHDLPDYNEPFEDKFNMSLAGSFGAGSSQGEKGHISEKNQLHLDMIAQGLDTRTTLMIKNIPNKMSDEDLMQFIYRVCPRRIDFLYLRIDFENGCNVGYAFVNFITVEDLLHFAQTQLGVKWNMYSSEKVLQMSYANYQGKEALVEKFKNSCIMDEREGWRPKIFYSDGPNQGLPEPFPAPTHLHRKERSASNRGALYTPGVHHSAHGRQCHPHAFNARRYAARL